MSDKKKDLLQPVDDAARRQARTLLRSERFAALGSLESDGYPAVSRINIATAFDGAVGFLISSLSGHFGNLAADGRCSLLLGDPGKGDPLAHPRLTLIGRATRLGEGPERTALKARYLMRHPKSALYADFADFSLWRFTPQRASLNAGFGKAYALKPADILSDASAQGALADMEAGAVAHMNADHAAAVDRIAARAGAKSAGWKLACIDPEGLDLTRGDETARLWFDTPLTSADQLRPVLVALSKG